MEKVKAEPIRGADTGADEPESAVQLKRRHRLDPRLDDISAAVRTGQLSLDEGLEQIVQLMSELAGRVVRPEERLALERVLRDAKSEYLGLTKR